MILSLCYHINNGCNNYHFLDCEKLVFSGQAHPAWIKTFKMAGLAPFGRDDQPLLEVKIVGGKRVEVAVDKYGKPLNPPKNTNQTGSSFQTQQYDRSSSVLSAANSEKSSVISAPPWVNRGDTPPRKILKSLEYPDERHSNSLEGLRKFSSPSSPQVLPPIRKKSGLDGDKTRGLASKLNAVLLGFDTLKLKDAYLSFAGYDSTLSGFVSADQIEREFFRLQIPVRGELLNELLALFMSAHRPNWVNYEQLLKFISNAVQPTVTGEFNIPQLDLSSKPGDRLQQKMSKSSPRAEANLPLKPNQISPRSDGMQKGRQSAIAVKKAFQDKQDTEILLQMEQMLKEINHAQAHVQDLRRNLEEQDVGGAEFISSQKLKTICLRNHIPFNNSLLDKIINRLDRYNSGKVSWLEFLSFVERALPLPAPSVSSSHSLSRDGGHGLETPPSRPVWETRQPLKGVSQEGRYPSHDTRMDHSDIYEEQQSILVKQLEEQKRGRNFRQNQIPEGRGSVEYTMSQEADKEAKQLDERGDALLRRQHELIEKKRQIQKEQEEIEQIIQNRKEKLYGDDRDYDPPHYIEEESRVKRFMKLANALFVCDQDQSGLIDADEARRLLNNYNLVNQLDFSTELIENTLSSCSTTDHKVSVDDLIDELKGHL